MVPETFPFATGDDAVRERIIGDPARWNLVVAHLVLPPGEAIPEHATDAEVFFLVVRGALTLRLGAEEAVHPRGTVVHLPKGTLMAPRNAGPDTAECFVLKTPPVEHA